MTLFHFPVARDILDLDRDSLERRDARCVGAGGLPKVVASVTSGSALATVSTFGAGVPLAGPRAATCFCLTVWPPASDPVLVAKLPLPL